MRAPEISVLLSERAEDLCRLLLPKGSRKGNVYYAGSTAGEAGKSLAVLLDRLPKATWKDWATGEHGDLIDLWRICRGIDLRTALDQCHQWLGAPQDFAPRQITHLSKPIPTRAPSASWIQLQKKMWPGTQAQLESVARLRKFPSTVGLQLASRHNQLWFGEVFDDGFDWPAWILTDSSRRNAQARRMDGQRWTKHDIKCKTIPGISGPDASWPIGLSECSGSDIAFVEGTPDFLAAWQLIADKERVGEIFPVCMPGTGHIIPADALPLFAGKTVWMFQQWDDAGRAAVARWSDQLRPFAKTIEVLDFRILSVPTKDINAAYAGGGQ